MFKRWIAVSLAIGTAACSTSGSAPSSGDASVAPANLGSVRAERVLGVLAKMPAFAGHLGEGRTLHAHAEGFRLPRGFRPTGATSMVVTAPKLANQPLRIADETDPELFIEVSDASLAAVAGEVQGSAIVFAGALTNGDVAEIIEPTRVEEVRVLDKPGEITVRYGLRTGKSITDVRLRNERVEFYDRSGALRVQTEPLFAVDANGKRKVPTVTLEGNSLVVSLDARDMTAPIALDPTFIITSTQPSGAGYNQPVVAISPTRAIQFATSSVSNALGYDAKTDKWTTLSTYPYSNRGGWTGTYVPSIDKVLLAGGTASGGPGTNSELYTWNSTPGAVSTGSMNTARSLHSAVLLGDGGSVPERVLVAGGEWGSVRTASVEWWDPGTATWSVRASMGTAKDPGRLAVFSYSGKQLVLSAGGRSDAGWLGNGEVYDPVANTWTPVSNSMALLRYEHTLTALPDGRVLIAGGSNSNYCCPITETTSIYQPSTNTFVAGPSMKYMRKTHAAILLPTGKVLITGGNGRLVGTSTNTSLSTTEIFDPATNTFSDGPNLNGGREQHEMVLLSGGRVLVSAGYASPAAQNEIYMPDGTFCTTTGPGCANCVDNYCCDSACTGQCQACDVPGRLGICTELNGEAPHGARATCSPYVTCALNTSTSVSSCAASCVGDTACASTSFCGGGTCVAKKANGGACSGGNQCVSGNCVDGFCCNTACTGQCYSCGESGKEGVCSTVDGAPRGTRPACPTSGYACSGGACTSTCTKDSECTSANYCGSGGACVPKLANGSTCTGATQCAGGKCSDGYCCNSDCTGACSACGPSGTCSAVAAGTVPAAPKSCGAYTVCNSGGVCATTCSSDAQCSSGFFCNTSGQCVVRRANGVGCLGNSECTSGFCAAGVCCNSACNGECEACNLPGKNGTCSAKSAGTACGLSGCVGGYRVDPSVCDGTSNTCPLGPISPCPNGVKCLDKTTCLARCNSDADCVTGACDTSTGKCASAWDGGGIDTGGPDTFVPDTFVPDTAVADTFVADSSTTDTFVPDTDPGDSRGVADVGSEPPFKGTTSIGGEFQRCSKNSECSTGFCVEGVCCDGACNDRCHSCALLSNPGKCTLEPVGVDLKQECGPALSCLGTCGPGGECVGSGSGTMCARNRCVGASKGVGPAYCAAPGATCNADEAVPFDCGAYICEPAFGACRTSCTATSDCSQGNVCDIPTKTCVAAPTPAVEGDSGDGGCAMGGRSSSGGAVLAALALMALGARRRR